MTCLERLPLTDEMEALKDQICAEIEAAINKLIDDHNPQYKPSPVIHEDDEKITRFSFSHIDENGNQVWNVEETYKQPLKKLYMTIQVENED